MSALPMVRGWTLGYHLSLSLLANWGFDSVGVLAAILLNESRAKRSSVRDRPIFLASATDPLGFFSLKKRNIVALEASVALRRTFGLFSPFPTRILAWREAKVCLPRAVTQGTRDKDDNFLAGIFRAKTINVTHVSRKYHFRWFLLTLKKFLNFLKLKRGSHEFFSDAVVTHDSFV